MERIYLSGEGNGEHSGNDENNEQTYRNSNV
jgi:hypothetical protein